MPLLQDMSASEYRDRIEAVDLESYRIVEKESDLRIATRGRYAEEALAALRHERRGLEAYIRADAAFLGALVPVGVHPRAPFVVREMAEAALRAGVGPMAAVAGALAERVGQHLRRFSTEVVVENGGDVFACVQSERVVALDAGDASPFSWKLGVRITREMGAVGVCTSSGSRGGSLSFGRADAACAIAASTALADAAATAIGNLVQVADDIEAALATARRIPGLRGAVVIVADRIGAWGHIELVEIA